jgi:pimeloyl-ACP methyl ester carboxylesterase
MTDHPIAVHQAEVNGVRLAYLEAGEGPLVLLVHGFPDDAWTWSNQIPALTDAGYRVVAPFLRGYPPSEVTVGACNSKNNSADMAALLRSVTDEPAYVVGHDWGGLATYGVIGTAPELIRRAAVIAVSHPLTLLPVLEKPALIHHLFHVWFFQVETLSEGAMRTNDFALVDYLWDYWTRSGHDDAAHVARLKREVFDQPAVVESLAGYYRALVRLPRNEPAFVKSLAHTTTMPMLAIWGRNDPGREAAVSERDLFEGEYRHEIVDDARHFVHREQPDRVNDLLLGWLDDAGDSAGRVPLEAARP